MSLILSASPLYVPAPRQCQASKHPFFGNLDLVTSLSSLALESESLMFFTSFRLISYPSSEAGKPAIFRDIHFATGSWDNTLGISDHPMIQRARQYLELVGRTPAIPCYARSLRLSFKGIAMNGHDSRAFWMTAQPLRVVYAELSAKGQVSLLQIEREGNFSGLMGTRMTVLARYFKGSVRDLILGNIHGLPVDFIPTLSPLNSLVLWGVVGDTVYDQRSLDTQVACLTYTSGMTAFDSEAMAKTPDPLMQSINPDSVHELSIRTTLGKDASVFMMIYSFVHLRCLNVDVSGLRGLFYAT
jgi:hypothetical protein